MAKMKFEEQPGFQHTQTEPRYFVSRFGESDREYVEGYRYEIQFLDEKGQAGAVLMLEETDHPIEVSGFDLPPAVVAAVHRQPKGSGDYVDSKGRSVSPY